LQKSFHLSHADKIELKKISSPSENKKYATAQTNTTKTMSLKINNDNGLHAFGVMRGEVVKFKFSFSIGV
jgi:hypothetical protein